MGDWPATKWDAPKAERRGFKDWSELMIKDHGLLRLRWHNLHQIDEMMWRSNQPTPKRLAEAKARGITTILNCRGPRNDGGWRLEAEACEKLGLRLLDFTARSRATPDKPFLYEARDIFAALDGPALLHCKSGADRAGIMSALYLLIHRGRPVREALAQLSFKYLHVKQAKTGLLDAFLEAYIPYEDQGVDFWDWVENHYDPAALQAGFMARGWANRLIDDVLRRE